MKVAIETSGMDKIIKSIDKLAKGIDLQELENWVKTIEKRTKQVCTESSKSITFKHSKGKQIYVNIKDRNSADCLTRAIESCIPSMSLFLQGVFTKFACEVRDAKFNY